MDFTDAKSSRPEFSVWDCCFVNGLGIYPLLSYFSYGWSGQFVIDYLPDTHQCHSAGIALIGTGMSVVDSRPWKKLKALWTLKEVVK